MSDDIIDVAGLELYLPEAEDNVGELDNALMILETEPANTSMIDEAFRRLHSIKGGAAALGFTQVQTLAHTLEDVFDQVRAQSRSLDEEDVALAFRAVDLFRAHIDSVNSGGDGRVDTGPLISQMSSDAPTELAPSASLEEALGKAGLGKAGLGKAGLGKSGLGKSGLGKAGLGKAGLGKSELGPVGLGQGGSGSGDGADSADGQDAISIQFDADMPLVELKVKAVLRRLAEVSVVYNSAPDATEVAANGGQVEIWLEPGTPEESIAAALSLDGVLHWTRASADMQADPLEMREQLKSDLGLATGAEIDVAVDDLARGDHQASSTAEAPGASETTASVTSRHSRMAQSTTLRLPAETLDEMGELTGELVTAKTRLEQIQIGTATAWSGLPNRAERRHLIQRIAEIEILCRSIEDEGLRRRVLDELVGISSVAERFAEGFDVFDGRTALSAQLASALDDLTRVADNIQDAVMAMRMMPLDPLFSRFRRVVRDLGASTKKQVHLVTKGESTELDKRLIDALGDPLMHLIRNAVDHGIESPDQRRELGKDPVATITLKGAHHGNSVIVTLSDDGRGIDPDKLRTSFADKGLLTPDEARTATDDELVEMIFRPGVTTAGEVTQLSGRGVGLDAVRTQIESIKGTVDVKSQAGQGTTISLRLPSTMAIIQGLVVRIGKHFFGIPIEDVQEVLDIDDVVVTEVGSHVNLQLRGAFLPVLDLESHMGVADANRATRPPFAVVINHINGLIAVPVDEPMGTSDLVIKSIGENLRTMHGLTGASFLGDGRVALIVNISAIAERSWHGRRPQ